MWAQKPIDTFFPQKADTVYYANSLDSLIDDYFLQFNGGELDAYGTLTPDGLGFIVETGNQWKTISINYQENGLRLYEVLIDTMQLNAKGKPEYFFLFKFSWGRGYETSAWGQSRHVLFAVDIDANEVLFISDVYFYSEETEYREFGEGDSTETQEFTITQACIQNILWSEGEIFVDEPKTEYTSNFPEGENENNTIECDTTIKQGRYHWNGKALVWLKDE